MNNPTKPFNRLPLLPPRIDFSKKIFHKTIEANKALAELKGLAGIIPNQAIILNSLILREAKDSSEVENIITTQDELYKAFSIDNITLDPNVKEVLNYREALWMGYGIIKKKKLLTISDIIKLQEVLIGNNAGIRSQPGTALQNAKTKEVIYTPPFGKEVIVDKLKNLETYINSEHETDTLIKMAIIHYQFESIHPFYDGNGRTGRIINVLYLILNGLLDSPILYLSSYIIHHKKHYYEGLEKVRTKNEWENWIFYMLDSVEQTSKSTIQIIKNIKALLDKEIENVRINCPKIYSKELVELLFIQPYSRISTLEEKLQISRFTASKYLKELEGIGLLKGEKIGRDILYINVPLYALLQKQDNLLK